MRWSKLTHIWISITFFLGFKVSKNQKNNHPIINDGPKIRTSLIILARLHILYIYIYIYIYIYRSSARSNSVLTCIFKAMCSAGIAHELRVPGIAKLLYRNKETLHPRSYSAFLAYYKSWQLVTSLFFFFFFGEMQRRNMTEGSSGYVSKRYRTYA